MLELLMSSQGRVVSAQELLERVWDEMADPFSTAVKVTMSRLRRKLGRAAGHRDGGAGRISGAGVKAGPWPGHAIRSGSPTRRSPADCPGVLSGCG